jgi:signal transduction histidine kinase
MKFAKTTFLYFFLFALNPYIGNNSIYSQNTSDSLQYYYKLVTNPKTNTDLTKAYNFYVRYKKQRLALKDTLNTIQAMRFIANIEKDLGFFNESEITSVEALRLLSSLKENKNNPKIRLGIYNHLGIVYRISNNYKQALKLYDKALRITDNRLDSISVLNNIGNVYLKQEKFKESINIFSKVYELSLDLNNDNLKARALSNLGFSQSKLKEPQGLQNMMEGLAIRKESNHVKGVYTSYRNLAKYYHDNKNPEKAKSYADKAYKLAKQINSTSYIEDALSNLVTLNTDTIVTAYKQLKDSIFKAKELSRNAYAFNKYNYEKKEKELANIQFKREREKIMYTSLGIILFIITLFTAYIVRQRHKKEKLKEVYATETRISQKVHDELANDVYHVMNNIQNSTQETGVLNQLENIYERTRDISYENAHIDLNNYALELKEMLNTYQNTSTTITAIGLNKTLFEDMKNHKKIAIARVLKELMTNMKKHSNASNVVISFKRVKKKMVITYTDDGVGFKKTGHFKSNGLQNAENRIKNINGSFNFDTNRTKGTAINIAFPV